MKKKIHISQRGQFAPASPIRKLVPLSNATKSRGIKIYHLNIGDPDFQLPDKIQQTFQSLAKSLTRLPYPAFRGQKSILESWKTYYKALGISHDLVDEDIIVTAGASDAMTLIAATIFDPGDECLVFEPFYAPYQIYASFLSYQYVPVSLDPKNGYHLPDTREIIKRITPKTKAIFFTNPNNPTGTVFSRSEMETILAIAREYNLFVVSDETYRGMVFDGRESLSMFHIAKKEDLDHIIIADSLSKRLNVCGARMGVAISKNEEFNGAAFRFTQGRPYAAYIEQEIVAPMLSDSLTYIAWLSKEYQKRRDAFITTLQTELDISLSQPEGAFYVMVQLPIDDAELFVKWMLTDFQINNETVMVSPGAGFYASNGKGKNEVRIAYVLQEEDLKKAAKLLALGVKEYNKRKKSEL